MRTSSSNFRRLRRYLAYARVAWGEAIQTDRLGPCFETAVEGEVVNEDGNDPGSPFLPTRWSLVERAGHPSQPGGRVALNEILVLYHPPLLAHLIRRRGLPPDRAEDLLQAFIAKRILEKKLLKKADRNRGKFRTFLLTSLDRFVSNEL
ncbi:MAG TPA: hypothetical protein VG742_20405, partial [Dongiaceae bacterium]|nr:hypothetical protein [Dongiaceae bacterium]